jgi:hypothetical protein
MDKIRKSKRCCGKTGEGKPCRAAATAGGLCFFHANPLKAVELGRKGGRRKRKAMPDHADRLPPLESMKAIRDFVARLTAQLYSGQIHPSVARGLAPLLQLQMRVLQVTDWEDRISRLEQKWDRCSSDAVGPISNDDGPEGASE